MSGTGADLQLLGFTFPADQHLDVRGQDIGIAKGNTAIVLSGSQANKEYVGIGLLQRALAFDDAASASVCPDRDLSPKILLEMLADLGQADGPTFSAQYIHPSIAQTFTTFAIITCTTCMVNKS